MSIGEWSPEGSKKVVVEVDLEFLQRLVTLASENNLDDIGSWLDAADVSQGAVIMTLDRDSWDILDGWDDTRLETLIRFFTLAEMQLPGWQAGNKSPVIALVKHLKQQNSFSPELRRWIKTNTDNRYLPNGSAL